MSSQNSNPSKLAFSSNCLPGSIAEQQAEACLAEFHRRKALREVEEASLKIQKRAEREQAYLAASEANSERIRRTTADRMARKPVLPR